MDEPAHSLMADGDVVAFEELVARERRPMLQLAVLLLGSREEAEDAVQDALAAVAGRWDELEEPGAYLRTSVVNACRMVLRRRRLAERHPEHRQTLAADAPASLVEIIDSLAVLSARERQVIVLRYLTDLPDDEIATALGCRPASVRSLARRGLAKLRKELA